MNKPKAGIEILYLGRARLQQLRFRWYAVITKWRRPGETAQWRTCPLKELALWKRRNGLSFQLSKDRRDIALPDILVGWKSAKIRRGGGGGGWGVESAATKDSACISYFLPLLLSFSSFSSLFLLLLLQPVTARLRKGRDVPGSRREQAVRAYTWKVLHVKCIPEKYELTDVPLAKNKPCGRPEFHSE